MGKVDINGRNITKHEHANNPPCQMQSMGVEVVPTKEDMNKARWQGIKRHQSGWDNASNKGWVAWPVLSHLSFIH